MGLADATLKAKALLTHPTIALDTNIFIFALENNLSFPIAVELFRLLPKIAPRVFTSTITLVEALVHLYRRGDHEEITTTLEFITGQGLITIVNVDQTVSLKAAQLRAQYKLTTPDAIQLATGLLNDAATFITADHEFRRRIPSGYLETMKIETI